MPKKFYIKERDNPQLGTYYVAEGQLTKKDARAKERSLYGANYLHQYETEQEYNAAIEKLKKDGKRIH